MPTTSYVDLAIQLLRDAAGFYRNVGEQNLSMKSELFDNADVYDQVADLLEDNPAGFIELENEKGSRVL